MDPAEGSDRFGVLDAYRTAVSRARMPGPVHDDRSIGLKSSVSVIGVAKSHGPGRDLDMQHRSGRHAGVERRRADTGQAPSNPPGSEHVGSLIRARVPAFAHPDHTPAVPHREVEPRGEDSAHENLMPTGETLMTFDRIEKK
jgi:hypothetical protein